MLGLYLPGASISSYPKGASNRHLCQAVGPACYLDDLRFDACSFVTSEDLCLTRDLSRCYEAAFLLLTSGR